MELDQNLIEEGKALVVKVESNERMTAEARFELGHWAERCVPQNQGSRSDLGNFSTMGEKLSAYAEAIGISGPTLQSYRDVAVAWGDDDPAGLSWTVARKLAYRTDRMTLIDSVFQMFGKVTPKTIDDYEKHIQAENERRKALFVPTSTDEEEEEMWEEEVEEEDIPTPAPASTSSITTRKHGFSAPVRKLEALVIHCRNTKDLILEESLPSVDYVNDENYEEILTMLDNITTDLMEIREALSAKRTKAGLSPEVG